MLDGGVSGESWLGRDKPGGGLWPIYLRIIRMSPIILPYMLVCVQRILKKGMGCSRRNVERGQAVAGWRAART